MQELRDATDALDDREALRGRLHDGGYLFFHGLLDPEPLHSFRAEMLRTVAELGWLEEGSVAEEARPSQPPRFHGGEGWRPGYIAIQKLEAFHRQAFDPALLAMLRSVLGDEVLVHGQRIARLIWPSETTLTTPQHQDFTHIQGTPDFVTTWLPLGDCPATLGGLRLVPGSQVGGVRPVRTASGAGGLASVEAIDDDAWATADYRVGDVVAFHSYTIHAGQPNTTDRLRLSVDYRYQSAREPVAINSLLPHNHPYVPEWDELTPGWSSTEWVPSFEGLDVTEMHRPVELDRWHEELGTPMSRLVTTTPGG